MKREKKTWLSKKESDHQKKHAENRAKKLCRNTNMVEKSVEFKIQITIVIYPFSDEFEFSMRNNAWENPINRYKFLLNWFKKLNEFIELTFNMKCSQLDGVREERLQISRMIFQMATDRSYSFISVLKLITHMFGSTNLNFFH